MASYLPLLCCLVAALPVPGLYAQNPAPAPAARQTPAPAASQETHTDDPLDGNYVVTLSPVEKDAAGFSIITAKQSFGVVINQTFEVFNATLFPQKNGTYLLDYRLKRADGTTDIASSVFLRLGEPMQIVKNGKQFYNLRLDHYPVPDPAKTGAEH